MRPVKGADKIVTIHLGWLSSRPASLTPNDPAAGASNRGSGMGRNTAVEVESGGVLRRPSHGPIDMDHLDQQSLGDPGLRDEVLRLYSQMSTVYLGRIEASTSIPLLLEHLHTLKSAAAGIGAWGVRDLTKRAEDDLRAGNPVNPEHIQDIALAVADCQAFIAELVGADEV
jgi:hypothetical protein